MGRRRWCGGLAAAVWLVAAGAMLGGQSASLQEAITLMETRGEYRAAIDVLEELASGGDRALAASSLLYIALCHEKLGETDAERQAYERIVADYADQREVAAEARNRLTALRTANTDVPVGPLARRVAGGEAYAISPDGRYLSRMDWNTGDPYLFDLSNRGRQALTRDAYDRRANGTGNADVSPDGRLAAYEWDDWSDGWVAELWLVGTDGSNPRLLFHDAHLEAVRPHAWTPDGQAVVVDGHESDGASFIGLVSASTGMLHRVRELGGPGPNKVSVSPDGRFLAYDGPASDDPHQRDIFLLPLDGSPERLLVSSGSDDVCPMWTPDGDGLVFLSNRSGLMALWAVAVEDGATAGSAVIVRPGMDQSVPIGIARDGSFFYNEILEHADIILTEIDLQTGERLAPARPIAVQNVGSNLQPAWSPDGTQLAFIARRGWLDLESQRDRLTIYDLPTGDVRVLEPDLGVFRGPRWTADGRAVRVFGWDNDGVAGLFHVDPESGDVTRIADGAFNAFDWSPDDRLGYHIGTDASTGREALTVRDLETGEERVIYVPDEGVDLSRPFVSPDGATIAFTASDDDARRLMFIAPDGTGLTERVRWEGRETLGQLKFWVPDGSGIVWNGYSAADDLDKVWLVPMPTGALRELALTDDETLNLRFDSDGRRVAYTSQSDRREIWVVENFLPKLLRR